MSSIKAKAQTIKADLKDFTAFWHSILSIVIGFVTGIGAGLIGVGGGEFRLPFLLWLFRKNIKTAAGVNLIIGTFTVVLAFIRRYATFVTISEHLWILALIFALFSALGAYIGARKNQILSINFLKTAITIYLAIVGIWMLIEAFAKIEFQEFNIPYTVALVGAAVFGFIIAAISAIFGVAGGEMRIPLLMYVFGMPIKIAGTLSLLISIPTVLSGAITYKSLGYLPLKALFIALMMAFGSLAGVLLGVYWLHITDKYTLKAILGLVLLLATLGITLNREKKSDIQ